MVYKVSTEQYAKGGGIDKIGKIQTGLALNDFLVTQYYPIVYDNLGSLSGGIIKLVNQENFDMILKFVENCKNYTIQYTWQYMF